jgi:hypothetical protein
VNVLLNYFYSNKNVFSPVPWDSTATQHLKGVRLVLPSVSHVEIHLQPVHLVFKDYFSLLILLLTPYNVFQNVQQVSIKKKQLKNVFLVISLVKPVPDQPQTSA